ncbi:Rho GTPase activation protein [Tribonema minus]|uniref:Rho GTPase activation protein n=1 Tax=Tribonema minus TaxID=303371 RepID=A0A835YT43_9STRA|nr:Rho GTPase activation protein [Tribonema minus]
MEWVSALPQSLKVHDCSLIERFHSGLTNPSNDENSGNIDAPLAEFARLRDDLSLMQSQIAAYVGATEAEFVAARQLTFLHAPRAGDAAKHVKAALCTSCVHDAVIRGMREHLCAPLRAVLLSLAVTRNCCTSGQPHLMLLFAPRASLIRSAVSVSVTAWCDTTDALAKRRAALVLDYDHHKRKLAAAQQRAAAAHATGRRASADTDERDAALRQAKLAASTNDLRATTADLLAHIAALSRVERALRDAVCRGLAAAAAARARAARLRRWTPAACCATPASPSASRRWRRRRRRAAAAAAARRRRRQRRCRSRRRRCAKRWWQPPRRAEADAAAAAADAAAAAEAAAAELEAHPPGALFGRSLAAWSAPPPPLREWVAYLDAHGLYVRGLFRLPAALDDVSDLKRRYDAGEAVALDAVSSSSGGSGGGSSPGGSTGSGGSSASGFAAPRLRHSVHDIAALLKMFFRELPEPLIPAASYRAALDAAAAPALAAAAPDGSGAVAAVPAAAVAAFVAAARPLLAALPPTPRACARLLFALLHRVHLCAGDNKMTAENLGIVFAPNLLRPAEAGQPTMAELQPCIMFVRRVVESAPDVFANLWDGYPSSSAAA